MRGDFVTKRFIFSFCMLAFIATSSTVYARVSGLPDFTELQVS
jgi:hypothetical protein